MTEPPPLRLLLHQVRNGMRVKTVLNASLLPEVHALELRSSSICRKLRTSLRGCVKRQEFDGFGNFLRQAETLHRNAFRRLNVDLICEWLHGNASCPLSLCVRDHADVSTANSLLFHAAMPPSMLSTLENPFLASPLAAILDR